MITEQTKVTDAAIGVGIADQPEELSVIHKPGCAAAIWRRQLPKGFDTWIDGINPDNLPSGRLVLRPDGVASSVQQLCDQAGLRNSAQRDWLTADIADLAKRFADLMRAPYLRFRLDVISTNACRRFHIDAITSRLICTYRGTGTQYGVSTDGSEPKRVFTVGTGSPMIMRGSLWPETPKSGLLHRSPPIEGSGETRLVLVLDPVSELDEIGDVCGSL
ncbi:hypothetical protein GCM10007385_39190 [Tateyamaria omphalii]|uniref:DUF1826 domain-containing protein n=1 Tax=Tateyamaria omphalii TaxID=299262 RepID=UPI0019942C99|nr:DUF1826 domain-containing protein [Tateyamaria omphalii]GGX66145.1 hypothetical protein GCM10007385_39190 [Tateyamaria omphalii]